MDNNYPERFGLKSSQDLFSEELKRYVNCAKVLENATKYVQNAKDKNVEKRLKF